MTKTEFLAELRQRLGKLNPSDLERSLEFYSEMIDDRMEDGMTEAEAVSNVGDVDTVVRQISAQPFQSEPERAENKPSVRETRYVLRNPWLVGCLSPFLLILWVLAISLITAFWCIVVALYAVDVALGAIGGALHVAGTALFFVENPGDGLLVFGAGVFLIGFTVLWSLGCKYAALGIAKITKWTFRGLVAMLLRKEDAV